MSFEFIRRLFLCPELWQPTVSISSCRYSKPRTNLERTQVNRGVLCPSTDLCHIQYAIIWAIQLKPVTTIFFFLDVSVACVMLLTALHFIIYIAYSLMPESANCFFLQVYSLLLKKLLSTPPSNRAPLAQYWQFQVSIILDCI